LESTEQQTAGVDEGILNALAERITERVLRRIVEQLRGTSQDGAGDTSSR
jgi:hypothetical protein